MPATRTAPRLSREVVADLAVRVADAEGLDAVTIRRLALELDVTPMALYWHFKTKDDLLDGLADRVLDALVVPAARDDWAHRVEAAVDALLDAMRPHPQVAPLLAHRLLSHPRGLALTELALAALADGGFTPTQSAQIAGQALTTAIQLVTAPQVDDSGTTASEHAGAVRQKAAAIKALDPAAYPNLVAVADDLVGCEDTDGFYRLGVDLFVAGVRGMAPRRRTRR